MPRTRHDEAIVLRTFNVGETDRFCILLTKNAGKLAARAQGARRLTSRRGRGLLTLHRIEVELEEHSFGYTLAASNCIRPHDGVWKDPHVFGCAVQGAELVLKLTEDGEPLPEIFALLCRFLEACDGEGATPPLHAFTLQLLDHLGLLPSLLHSCISHTILSETTVSYRQRHGGFCGAHEDRTARKLHPETMHVLRSYASSPLERIATRGDVPSPEVSTVIQGLLSIQLGGALTSVPVSAAISSGVTPICQ